MKTDLIEVDPREIQLLELNARWMPFEQYTQLVANVKRDGALTSVPFCWTLPDGRLEVLSGNHRVQAAVDADLATITVMATADPLDESERLAIQLSHNSIAGQDDPATLKQLYDSISDVELREYAGLDDKTLDLLQKVDVGALGEANLDFASIQLIFLPPEKAAAEAALDEAAHTATVDQRWMARLADHSRMLDALEATHHAYKVGNVATAIGLILDVFERHRTDLQDGWWDSESDEPRHKGWVPLSTIFGRDTVPAAAAIVIARAVQQIATEEQIETKGLWQTLEYLAAERLSSSGPDPAHLALP